MFIRRIERFINKNNLLDKDQLHIIALSGGADSVALLRAMLELEYHVEVAHCNFQLRGKESERDELFCKELCKKHNIPFHSTNFNTKLYSAQNHVSIEMAARELRYKYFFDLLKERGAASICVAHHKNDCAETFLMNAVRGTGIQGLSGIRPKNGVVVRPLLCVNRDEIEDFLTSIHQDYVTDSTNLVDDVKRNKVRLNIMPLLSDINPSIIDALSITAQHVTEVLPLLNEAVDKYKKIIVNTMCEKTSMCNDSDFTTPFSINIEKLKSCPSPNFLLFEILNKFGFSSQTINQIADNLDSQTGSMWTCGDMKAVIDRGSIIIDRSKYEFSEKEILSCGVYNLENGDSISIEQIEYKKDTIISHDINVAQLDADSLCFPLTLRKVKNGDRFSPFGMKGSKLVSDFLTDRKLSIIEKEKQLCLVDNNGNIVWIVGQRINDKNRITPNTINLLRVRYYKKAK